MDNENSKEKTNDNAGKKPDNSANTPKTPGNRPKFNTNWIYGIIAIALFGLMFLPSGDSDPKEVTWNRFEQEMLKNHDVNKIVVVNKEKAMIYI